MFAVDARGLDQQSAPPMMAAMALKTPVRVSTLP